MRKLLRWIQLYDFIWSTPLAFGVYYLVGHFMQDNLNASYYDEGWYHRGLTAMALMLLAHLAVMLGMLFNHRKPFDYYYSKKSTIKEDFQNLPVWLKVLYYPLLYFAYIVVFLSLFHGLKP